MARNHNNTINYLQSSLNYVGTQNRHTQCIVLIKACVLFLNNKKLLLSIY